MGPLATIDTNRRPHGRTWPSRKYEYKSVLKPSMNDINKTGRWEACERLAFLRGLRKYGRGKWKMISMMIPTRCTIQVKTHAQVLLKRLDDGENIFEELDLAIQKALAIRREYQQGTFHRQWVLNNPRPDELIAASALLLLRNCTPA